MSISQNNTRMLYWISLLSGITLLEPVLTLFYLSVGLSVTNIFFVLMSFSVAILIFEVPTGAFADRYGAKKSFLVGTAVKIASLGLLFFADNQWWVYASQVLSGLSATFFSGSLEALLYESLKKDGRESEMSAVSGKITGASMLPKVIGLLVGAWVAKDLTATQFHLLIGTSAFFVLLQLFFIARIIEPNMDEYRDHPWNHVKQGIREIKGEPNLLWLFTNVTVVFISTYLFTTFEQPWLQNLGLPIEMLGFIYAGGYLLAYFASTYIGWLTKRISEVALMHISGVVIILSYVATVVFDQWLYMAITAVILVRVARQIRWPLLNGIGNEYISASRATTLSLLSILDSFFDVVFVSAVAVFAAWGIHEVYWGCVAIAILGSLLPVRRANKEAQVDAGNEVQA